MKIELTENEREYLSDKVFWDIKRAEIDLQAGEVMNASEEDLYTLKGNLEWYKNIYAKLEGEDGQRD